MVQNNPIFNWIPGPPCTTEWFRDPRKKAPRENVFYDLSTNVTQSLPFWNQDRNWRCFLNVLIAKLVLLQTLSDLVGFSPLVWEVLVGFWSRKKQHAAICWWTKRPASKKLKANFPTKMYKFITKLVRIVMSKVEQKMAKFSLLKWRAIWGTRCGWSIFQLLLFALRIHVFVQRMIWSRYFLC